MRGTGRSIDPCLVQVALHMRTMHPWTSPPPSARRGCRRSSMTRLCGPTRARLQTTNSHALHESGACIRRCDRLPSLDFLRGFEAAGRRLSFTLAATELFVTQSALSRQVKALEDALGVALFERRHRALALTPAGAALHRDGHRRAASRSPRGGAGARRRAAPGADGLDHRLVRVAVGDSAPRRLSRAPSRASRCTSRPTIALVDLSRGDVDVAVRYLGERSAPRRGALVRRADDAGGEPEAAARQARASKRRRPRASRAPAPRRSRTGVCRGSTGGAGWRPTASPDLKPAGSLRFSIYDQVSRRRWGARASRSAACR